MAQSAIGKAALVLTTDAGAARAGLAKFGGDARKWADDTARGVKARLGSVGTGLGGGLLGSVPRVAAAAGAMVVSIGTVKAAVETVQDISRQGAIADAFGLSVEKFSAIAGLAKSVGGNTREFTESLVTLGKVASEGAAGKGEVAVQFFKDLNFNAQEFNALPLDEKFFRVFEAAKQAADPVRVLSTAFGEDGGKDLIPLLSRAPDELRKLAAGFAITAEQVRQARMASEAFARAQVQIERLWRRIVVAAAPVLEFLANELGHTVDQFSRMEKTAVPALSKILRLTAQLADATKAVTAATLIATGVRLKFASAEIGLKAAFFTARTGVGIPLAGAAGAAAAALFEKQFGGAELRQAGGFMFDAGIKMLADVGGSAKRVEGFISELEARKPGAAPTARLGAAPTAPDLPKPTLLRLKSDNEALLAGTSAEVSARIRHDFSGKSAQDQMLAEEKKHTALLKDVVGELRSLASSFVPTGGLLSF